MTRIASSLNPAPSSLGAPSPAGGTSKATTPQTNGSTCRDQFDASASVLVSECASEASPLPQMVEGHPSNTGIPTLGGGVRLARAPETHVPVRQSGKDTHREGCAWELAKVHHKPFARCAGTTSAESVESRLLGSQGVEVSHTIPQRFERLNRAQMRADRRSDWVNALPPVWFLFVAGGAILFALFTAHTINSAFFDWMVAK